MNKVRAAMAERGVRANWVADRVGLSHTHFYKIVAGIRTPPMSDFYDRVATALGCDAADLVDAPAKEATAA